MDVKHIEEPRKEKAEKGSFGREFSRLPQLRGLQGGRFPNGLGFVAATSLRAAERGYSWPADEPQCVGAQYWLFKHNVATVNTTRHFGFAEQPETAAEPKHREPLWPPGAGLWIC